MSKILVHLRAPVKSASGYGVHSRQVMDYLLSDDRFQVVLEDIPWGNTPSIHGHDLEDPTRLDAYYEAMRNYEGASSKKIPFDISLQVTIPNEFVRRGKVNIGITAGIEVDRADIEWIRKCNQMDLIVVPSKFSAEILGGTAYQIRDGENTRIEKLERQIIIIPEWFSRPKNIESLDDVKFSTDKNFLFVGLWGNKGGFGEDRKNIADLLRIFLTEFKDDSNVGLVLKTSIITNSPEDLFHTKEKINQIKSLFPDSKCKIHLIHDHLTDSQMWGLYQHKQIQGFISLTHGEGWGLPLLEASAAGLPIIATDWSGHKDFLRVGNGFLPIGYELKEIPECQNWPGVMMRPAQWACVDEDDTKNRMRRFAKDSSTVRVQAKRNIEWLNENFSKDKVLSTWRVFFDEVLSKIGIAQSDEEDIDHEVLAVRNHRNQVLNISNQLKKDLNIDSKTKKKAVFIIPRSFGDCVIATSIIQSLIVNRHGDDDFYIVTSPQYTEIFSALVRDYQAIVIPWNDIFMNDEVCRNTWDYVYNPTVNVQYTFSNWNIGNGEYGVRILEEFAKSCNLNPSELIDFHLNPEPCKLPKTNFVSITPVTSKQSKNYKYWSEVVHNLRLMGDFEIVQLGDRSETLLEGVLDYRGKTFNETIYVVSRSILHISPDTGTAHVAGACGVPHIVLFGSTSYGQCAPVLFRADTPQIVIESENTCELKCYKDVCFKMDDGKNCLSHISPKTISEQAFSLICSIKEGKTKLPVLRLDSASLSKKADEWMHFKSLVSDVKLIDHLELSEVDYDRWVHKKFEEL